MTFGNLSIDFVVVIFGDFNIDLGCSFRFSLSYRSLLFPT